MWVGCGSDSADDSGLLAPPPEGQGVQYQMLTSVEAATEVEQCLFVQAPAEGILVNRDEVRFTSGSHHFLLYETTYDEIPTRKENGQEVDTSGVFDCTDGPTNGWDVTKLIGGSQNGTGDSMLAFPEGVAVRVRPNAVLLMNAHYINASDEELRPEVRINLYSIEESALSQEGDLLFLYNPFIKVGAMGTGRSRWRCPVHTDITITNVQSHMHARGVGYAASITGEDPFYENELWEDVPVKTFANGLQVSAGSTLDYYCDYVNGETRDVFQGPKSTDEMCMLIGSYYPRDNATANCEDAQGELAGEWVGNGSATCAQTLTCIDSITGLESLTDCVDASDPSVAEEMSTALNCLLANSFDEDDCTAELADCQSS